MADAKMIGKEKLLAKFSRVTPRVIEAVTPAFEDEVEAMRQAISRAAPENEFDKHPGQLKEEIVSYPNTDRPLSARIIAAARDAAGRLYGAWVEFGHNDAAPVPYFWPTYRAKKKPLRSKLYAEARKALTALFAE